MERLFLDTVGKLEDRVAQLEAMPASTVPTRVGPSEIRPPAAAAAAPAWMRSSGATTRAPPAPRDKTSMWATRRGTQASSTTTTSRLNAAARTTRFEGGRVRPSNSYYSAGSASHYRSSYS